MRCYSMRLIRALWPWFLTLALVASSAEAREKGTRLVSSSGGGMSFEVTVPAARIVSAAGGAVKIVIDGYGTFSPPGAVELPGAAFRIAIPPIGEPRVTATVLEEERLGPLNLVRVAAERFVEGQNGMAGTEQYYPPDPWANGGGLPLVEARHASFMGRQRVLPIRVSPLIMDASGARLVRKLSITVSFGSAGAQTGIEDLAQSPVSLTWKHIYDELLVNPDDASKFRKPLARVQAMVAPGEAGKKLKIRVPETGIYAVRADSLIAAGLSAGLSTGEIALKKYYYDETMPDLLRKVDVPILVIESPSTAPGVFDGGDEMIFYALGIKDDAQTLDTDALYTNDNVFWLEEEVAGTLMNQAPPPPTTPGDLIPQFTATMKYRKDAWYMKNAVPGTHDFYYAKAPDLKSSAVSFTLHHPAPAGTFSLALRLQGDDPMGYFHTVSFSVRNSTGTHAVGSTTFTGKAAKTVSFTGLSSSWLVDGQNDLVFVCDIDYGYLINDFEIDYTALFAAHGDELEFAVDPAVDTRTIEITGFTVNSGWLIDITNPGSPLYWTLGPADFTADGALYKLELEIGESFSARRFIALGHGAGDAVHVRSISVDAPSQLRQSPGPYQALIISHKDFLQRIGDYATMRRNQGYRLMTADVDDVYDEFNGGLPSANAIKRYIKYGASHWGVEFVLLVGDASVDHKRLYVGADPNLQGSPPDFVPSFNYSTDVSGTFDDEVICSDKWYAFLDESVPLAAVGASGEDILQGDGYPDVIIGRLPVGRDVELRALLTKINRMETPQPDDAWRRRITLFSDDAWSGRGSDYRYNSYEQAFEDSTEACGATIESALPGGFDVHRLYLSQYTDPIHPDRDESGPAVLTKSTTQTRAKFTPALNRALNQGCLWYMFQGHANRTVLTTESAYSLGWYMDIDSLRTYTPFIFMGFGCHISDFDIWQELSAFGEAGPYGDCMSEQLLFRPGSGAVATYASVGFEYLTENAQLAGLMHRMFFQMPPADSVGPRKEYTGAHWIFGEAVEKAEIEEIDQGGLGMVLRYTILGDPMLKVDLGPPLIRLEADWGAGYQIIASDTMRARNGSNLVKLRLAASDIVAIGKITLQVNGEDRTSSLTVTPLVDADKTYARSYTADFNYTIDPTDELLVLKVYTPTGSESGVVQIPIVTKMRLFFNDYLEILPGVDAPPSGAFRLKVDFPAYLSQPPELSIDGVVDDAIHFSVPDQRDSLHWEAAFEKTFTPGLHILTLRTGTFSRDFTFDVTGNDLVVNSFSFPNPFSRETNIVYSLNVAAEDVTIDIYTVSGLRIRRLELPPDRLNPASLARPHSVLWDGRDLAGDRVANGTYIYVLRVRRGGQTIDIKGKSVKLE